MPVLIRPLARTLQATILNICQLLPMLAMHHAVLVHSLVLAVSTTQSLVFPVKVHISTCLISTNAFLHAQLPTSSMLPNAHFVIPTATNAMSPAPIARLARLECILLLIQLVSPLVPINIMLMIKLKVVLRALLLVLLAIIAIFAVLVPLEFFTPKHVSPPVLLKLFTILHLTLVCLVLITVLLAKIPPVFA